MSNPDDQPKIIIDEDWKSQVQAEKEAAEKAEAAKAESGTEDAPAASAGDESDQPLPPLPPPSFTELLTMFATQASVSLQQAADPNEQQRGEHLAYAKHFIDLLAVLEVKTKGNLIDEEAKLIDNLLHDLRMAFVSLNR